MSISVRALNRSTLGRQLLLQRESLGVGEAMRRVVALQAQHPAGPYLALWNRLTDFDPAELDAAFATYTVVRSTLLRITMHAVHAGDYRDFREAMEPTLRASRLRDPRFTASGLMPENIDALLPELLDFAVEPRTAAEYEAWLEDRLGAPAHPGVWWALRQYAPFWHVPVGEPWSFVTQRMYVAASTRPTLADPEASAAALQTLIKRYLEGFGPASFADMAQFAMVHRSRARGAVRALGDELEQLKGPNGTLLYDLPGASRPADETPVPARLLGMWDNVLLAYVDRSRVIADAYRKLVTRINGDVLPTLLVDGYVAGVWRPVEDGIEATAFHPLPDDTWHELAAEARKLVPFLASREREVYRRYDHWWKKLPEGEIRLLPGD
jgi:hypothetical protein